MGQRHLHSNTTFCLAWYLHRHDERSPPFKKFGRSCVTSKKRGTRKGSAPPQVIFVLNFICRSCRRDYHVSNTHNNPCFTMGGGGKATVSSPQQEGTTSKVSKTLFTKEKQRKTSGSHTLTKLVLLRLEILVNLFPSSLLAMSLETTY